MKNAIFFLFSLWPLFGYSQQSSSFSFTVWIRTGLRDVSFHKLIAEREVLTLGRECALEEYPEKKGDWICDFDGRGDVICQVLYECLKGGGSRHEGILGIENLLRREKWGKRLDEVSFKSTHGNYSLKTTYGEEDGERGLLEDPREEKRRKTSLLIQKQGEKLEAEWKEIGKKRKGRGMKFLEFDLSYQFIVDSDLSDSGISSGVSWNPRYDTGGFFSLGLDVGVKELYDEVMESFFLSMDLSLSSYFFLSDNFYFKILVGGQQWWERQEGTYSLLGVGLGVGMRHFIHRIFIHYARVGNDERNEEIHAGVGFSF